MKKELLLKQSAHELAPDHAFNAIDLIKFLGAFLVLIGHVTPFQTGTSLDHLNFYLQSYVIRFVVPFYFMSAGFFLFRKTDLYNLNAARIKSYVFKLIFMRGIWAVILFQGGAGHLWYISSLIVAVLLVCFLFHRGFKIRNIAIMALFAYAFGVIFGDTYHGLLESFMRFPALKMIIVSVESILPTTRNGVFFGFLFVLMGAIFAHKRIVMPKIVAVLGLIVSLALWFAEVLWLRSHYHPETYEIMVGLIPTLFFLFYVTSHLNLKNRPIYGKLRVIGLLIYFSHLFVYHYVNVGIQFIQSTLGPDLKVLAFPATLAVTVVLAVVIERASKKKKFRWLRYLYS